MNFKTIFQVFLLLNLFTSCDVEKIDPDDLVTPEVPASEVITGEEQPTGGVSTIPETQFPVSAVIDGVPVGLTNIFRNGEAINSFFHRNAVFIEVFDGVLLGSKNNFTISICRSDLKVGTYKIGNNSVFQEITHIDFTNDLNNVGGKIDENTISGTLTITDLDTVNRVVAGTFEFEVGEFNQEEVMLKKFNITNGKFRLLYDEANPDPNDEELEF